MLPDIEPVTDTMILQDFPEDYVKVVTQAVELLQRGVFTKKDFERYAEEKPSPLDAFFDLENKSHRHAILTGLICPKRE